MRPHRGFSAPEMIAVLMIVAVLLAIAIPRIELTLDRISVHAAAGDVRTMLEGARALALASHHPVAVDIVRGAGILRVWRDSEAVATRAVSSLHEVELTATRDSMAYDARGLGYGAANLSVVLRRRAAAETVFVSRLGRVR